MSEDEITLYRFFDAEDRLLYIGVSSRFEMRQNTHRATQPWWPDVARSEVQPLTGLTRAQAQKIEAAAIITERPLHNTQHNPDRVPPQREPKVRQASPSEVLAEATGVPLWLVQVLSGLADALGDVIGNEAVPIELRREIVEGVLLGVDDELLPEWLR